MKTEVVKLVLYGKPDGALNENFELQDKTNLPACEMSSIITVKHFLSILHHTKPDVVLVKAHNTRITNMQVRAS